MAKTAMIKTENGNRLAGLRAFFADLLALEDIAAILVPRQLPMKAMVMPALVSDPEQLAAANPLAPAFALNAARIVSRLTRKPAGGTVVAVLRPCEIRAFVELVKLKQGRTEELLIVGIDCLGAYANKAFLKFAADGDIDAATGRFLDSALNGGGGRIGDAAPAAACQACDLPIAEGADLRIGLIGADPAAAGLPVEAGTQRGQAVLERLDLPAGQMPAGRAEAIEALVQARSARRDEMFAATGRQVDSLEKLTAYLGACINCYNCRVACPVCYCRECVFVTDVFDHEPSQYLGWAARKGVIKMPTDTVFYHLTRLAHMSTACVGCGQCSNACPNEIPVMELFRTVAARTQASFGYQAGRSLEEKPPLAEFREKEFEEVVGIK